MRGLIWTVAVLTLAGLSQEQCTEEEVVRDQIKFRDCKVNLTNIYYDKGGSLCGLLRDILELCGGHHWIRCYHEEERDLVRQQQIQLFLNYWEGEEGLSSCDIVQQFRQGPDPTDEHGNVVEEAQDTRCSEDRSRALIEEYSLCEHRVSQYVSTQVHSDVRKSDMIAVMCQGIQNISSECFPAVAECSAAEDAQQIYSLHINQLVDFFQRISEGEVTDVDLRDCNSVRSREDSGSDSSSSPGWPSEEEGSGIYSPPSAPPTTTTVRSSEPRPSPSTPTQASSLPPSRPPSPSPPQQASPLPPSRPPPPSPPQQASPLPPSKPSPFPSAPSAPAVQEEEEEDETNDILKYEEQLDKEEHEHVDNDQDLSHDDHFYVDRDRIDHQYNDGHDQLDKQSSGLDQNDIKTNDGHDQNNIKTNDGHDQKDQQDDGRDHQRVGQSDHGRVKGPRHSQGQAIPKTDGRRSGASGQLPGCLCSLVLLCYILLFSNRHIL